MYSTNIGTEHFKHGIYSPFFSLQNAVGFIILAYLIPVLFTFSLRIWERKVLRKIFGPICVAGYWRSRTNEEVRQLYGELDMVTEIKKGRFRWLGHVERMSEERVVKRLYQNTPEGSRSVGRPSLRWMDDVREDLRMMGVTTWRIRSHRRDDWKTVVKEAKVLKGL